MRFVTYALAAFAKGTPAIKAQQTGPFGFSEKTPVIPKLGASPEIMEAAFNLTVQASAAKTPFKIGDRWIAIRLKNLKVFMFFPFERETF